MSKICGGRIEGSLKGQEEAVITLTTVRAAEGLNAERAKNPALEPTSPPGKGEIRASALGAHISDHGSLAPCGNLTICDHRAWLEKMSMVA